MMADAESYLRENFMADWSENRLQVYAGNDLVVIVPDATILPDIFKNCKKNVSLFRCVYNDSITSTSLSGSN